MTWTPNPNLDLTTTYNVRFQVQPGNLRPGGAVTASAIDAAVLDGSDGGRATTIEPGESLDLEFAAPPVRQGLIRDLFLVSRGVHAAFVPGEATQSSGLPVRFALAQNQPNPFASATRIRFELPIKAKVRLEVFDLLGRRVRVLADREFEAGYESVDWDRRDRSGSTVGPGVFLYRMTTTGFRDQKKMVLFP